jgi:hypothetical protein
MARRRTAFLVLGMGVVGAIVIACSSSDPPAVAQNQDSGSNTNPDPQPGNDGSVGTPDDSATPNDSGVDANDGAPSCSLPGSFGSAQCNECMANTCCGVGTACAADAACLALLTCAQGCLDEPDIGACMGECHVNHPDGETLYTPVEMCIITDEGGCAILCTSE